MTEFDQGMLVGVVVMTAYFWAKEWGQEHGLVRPHERAFIIGLAVAFVAGLIRGIVTVML